MAFSCWCVGKRKWVLRRTQLIQHYAGHDGGISGSRRDLGRDILYFQSLVAPHQFYYYPQSNTTTHAAYSNRHSAVILPEYEPDKVSGLYRHLKQFRAHPAKLTRQQYVDRITDHSKRKMYQNAVDELEAGRRVSSRVMPFTKIEKLSTGKYKAPRMIQGRDIVFNVEYGRYIKPIEDKCGKRVQFAKGTNLDIANKIKKLSKHYKYFTECDHKTFDAHVTVEMLKLTHVYYQACFHHDLTLRKLSKKTLNNNCRGRDGIKYRVKGTRMSGDVDTSLGNSLINYAILKEAVTKIAGKCEIIVNGDDSIIFTNRPLDVDAAKTLLKTFNMESEIQDSVTCIHKVEFCRHRYILNSLGKPSMMIDPRRITNIYGMTYKQQSDYVEYLREVCVCNIAINISNPVSKYWKEVYDACWSNIPIKFCSILDFQHVELRTRLAAIKEVVQRIAFDTGELNITVYRAFGNLDDWLESKYKVIKHIKMVMGLSYTDIDSNRRPTRIFKINSDMIKYLPVSMTLQINHNAMSIRKIEN